MWIISSALLRGFENSRCSPGQAAEYSADTCLDGEQSAPLSGPHILRLYLPHDKMTDFSRLSRFGVMCKPLTASHGADVLMWYLADFPVKTLAQQARAQESTANDPACGRTWQGLLARYNQFLSLWKTPQCSLLEDSDVFSETWPRSGTMRNGCAYQRQSVERRISATESGYSLPTPTCNPEAPNKNANTNGPKNLLEVANGKWDHLWPTPTQKGMDGGSNSRKAAKDRGMWPTPCASDNRDRGNASTPAISRRIAKGKQVMLSMAVSQENGRLNPTWVEWLMGWPLGLTDLRPLETDKFREWQQQHFLSFT